MSDDARDFSETPLFQRFLDDAGEVADELARFNDRYESLIRSDSSTMSLVLRCHLVVEHFMDEYLLYAHPGIEKWREARLSFAQKIAIIDNPRTSAWLMVPGIRALNRARNKMAHTLTDEISEAHLLPMEELVASWHAAAGQPIVKGVDAIPRFTLLACTFLNSATGNIKRYAPSGGIAGLLDWYKSQL